MTSPVLEGRSRSVIGAPALERLVAEIRAAIRRRPAHESRLAGTLRAVSCHSAELRSELMTVVETVARRGSFERPLYGAAVRCLSEQGETRLAPVLARALGAEEAGGLSSLAAACFTQEASLGEPLFKVAMGRHPLLAFAAEIARLSRRESQGTVIEAIAPKIKEAHRIALCSELFVTLLYREPLPRAVAPALAVLRDAERHMGRWLLLGELATRAGDPSPLQEAERRAKSGPQSSRAAWSLVAWALEPQVCVPSARPTVDLISRLSDRPSAERDATFLFRMAAAKLPSARPMLEGLTRGATLSSEVSVRAALHLVRDYGQEGQVGALQQAGRSPRLDAMRALAAAALYDCGQPDEALRMAAELETSRQLPAIGWASLVRASAAGAPVGVLVSERNFRRVQQGSCE
jgi:hypothetical protein